MTWHINHSSCIEKTYISTNTFDIVDLDIVHITVYSMQYNRRRVEIWFYVNRLRM